MTGCRSCTNTSSMPLLWPIEVEAEELTAVEGAALVDELLGAEAFGGCPVAIFGGGPVAIFGGGPAAAGSGGPAAGVGGGPVAAGIGGGIEVDFGGAPADGLEDNTGPAYLKNAPAFRAASLFSLRLTREP